MSRGTRLGSFVPLFKGSHLRGCEGDRDMCNDPLNWYQITQINIANKNRILISPTSSRSRVSNRRVFYLFIAGIFSQWEVFAKFHILITNLLIQQSFQTNRNSRVHPSQIRCRSSIIDSTTDVEQTCTALKRDNLLVEERTATDILVVVSISYHTFDRLGTRSR